MKFNPEKTAIKRNKPSRPAKYVAQYLIPRFNPKSILDYGCGYGVDITSYKDYVDNVQGYDSAEKFGLTDRPVGLFDLITCSYVLNVVSDPVDLVKRMGYHLMSNGKMFLTSRSKKAIVCAARRSGWKRTRGGYISDSNKGTFQKGISKNYYKTIAKQLSLKILKLEGCNIPGAVCCLLSKR
jgi:2-polyprenyl-3-methyl-5-hydroxy-6-metoxy-1,4-benzoquinol methylase